MNIGKSGIIPFTAFLLAISACAKEAPTAPLPLEIDRGDLLISVRSEIGLKVRDAYVSLTARHWPEDTGIPGLRPDSTYVFTKRSDVGGRVLFRGFEAGTHELKITAAGYDEYKAEVTVDTNQGNEYEARLAHTPDTWVVGTPRPELLYLGAVAGINGKLYVICAVARSEEGIYSYQEGPLYIFDPAVDEWSQAEPIPTPRDHAAAAGIDGKMYVVGGNQAEGQGTFTTLEVYDPQLDSWETRAPIPEPRAYANAVGIEGKLYVVGGGPAELAIYDPFSDSWSAGAPMPVYRGGTACGAIDGRLYMVGGYTSHYTGYSWESGPSDILEVYNPETDSWSMLTPMPVAVEGQRGGVLSGRLHVVGGGIGYPMHYSYDPVSDSWRECAAMLDGRSNPYGAVVNNKFYILGGFNPFSSRIDVQIYTP